MDSRNTKKAAEDGAAMRAKQPGCRAKEISRVFWPGAILEGEAGMSFICPWW